MSEAEYRRRPGLRRYSFTYTNGKTYSFWVGLKGSEGWALKLARDVGIFQDLQDGEIVSFEWAKLLR